MDYTQLFRRLREARGLSHEQLARRARCHRNTVANVEAGRSVKFRTIADLLEKMDYPAASAEMKSIALLWLESVSGLPFSRGETAAAARRLLAGHERSARAAARQLADAVIAAGLSAEQIRLLGFAAAHPGTLAILGAVRGLLESSGGGKTAKPAARKSRRRAARPAERN